VPVTTEAVAPITESSPTSEGRTAVKACARASIHLGGCRCKKSDAGAYRNHAEEFRRSIQPRSPYEGILPLGALECNRR